MSRTAEAGENEEKNDINQEIPADAENTREPSGQRYRYNLSDEIAGWDPGAFVFCRRDATRDIPERGVGDLDVKDRHEGAQHRSPDSNPGLEIRFFRAVRIRAQSAHPSSPPCNSSSVAGVRSSI
jgi:hypothetical protein